MRHRPRNEAYCCQREDAEMTLENLYASVYRSGHIMLPSTVVRHYGLAAWQWAELYYAEDTKYLTVSFVSSPTPNARRVYQNASAIGICAKRILRENDLIPSESRRYPIHEFKRGEMYVISLGYYK